MTTGKTNSSLRRMVVLTAVSSAQVMPLSFMAQNHPDSSSHIYIVSSFLTNRDGHVNIDHISAHPTKAAAVSAATVYAEDHQQLTGAEQVRIQTDDGMPLWEAGLDGGYYHVIWVCKVPFATPWAERLPIHRSRTYPSEQWPDVD